LVRLSQKEWETLFALSFFSWLLADASTYILLICRTGRLAGAYLCIVWYRPWLTL
jgi:hypothetical protein